MNPSSFAEKTARNDREIADLQRQKKDLEAHLDDTQRSQDATAAIVEKIIELKRRSEELTARRIPKKDE